MVTLIFFYFKQGDVFLSYLKAQGSIWTVKVFILKNNSQSISNKISAKLTKWLSDCLSNKKFDKF